MLRPIISEWKISQEIRPALPGLYLAVGVAYARVQNQRAPGRAKISFGKALPWFVLGFLGLTLLRTIGVAIGLLPQDVAAPGNLVAAAQGLKLVDEVAKFAILVALAAIGLSTDTAAVRRTGLKPFAMGLGLAASLALFSLGLIRLVRL